MNPLWLLIISCSLAGMDQPADIVPGNFDYHGDIDSQEVSEIAMSIYFDQEDPELFQVVFPKVKARLRDINTLPEVLHKAISHDLARIKKSNHRHSYHSYQQQYPDLHIYLNKIVYKAMKEAFVEERSYSNQVQEQKNCYKIATLTAGALGVVLTVGGTLIAHFVQPDCPPTS